MWSHGSCLQEYLKWLSNWMIWTSIQTDKHLNLRTQTKRNPGEVALTGLEHDSAAALHVTAEGHTNDTDIHWRRVSGNLNNLCPAYMPQPKWRCRDPMNMGGVNVINEQTTHPPQQKTQPRSSGNRGTDHRNEGSLNSSTKHANTRLETRGRCSCSPYMYTYVAGKKAWTESKLKKTKTLV